MSLPLDQIAAVSRLFSSGVVRELARKGRSPAFARLVAQSGLLDVATSSVYVHELFESAFVLLKKEGLRDEYVYKAALTQKVLLGRHSLQTASMLNEFRVGDCKADLAILNGTSTVYEVKSERDSLTRLEKQVAAYSRVFSSVYVLASEHHIDSVLRLVPADVGVLRLNQRYQISEVREAANRPERTSAAAIFDAIRTSEAEMILRSLGVPIPAVPNTEIHSTLRALFVKLEPRVAHAGMVSTLKRTRNLKGLAELIKELPPSLHAAALSVPLRKVDHRRLIRAVNSRSVDAMAWA